MEISPVKYGRRKGELRASTSPTGQNSSEFDTDKTTKSLVRPDGTDLRQVTVLSKSDWGRIAGHLERKQREQERLLKQVREKEALHQKSTDMVKNWSNTIAGQRQKKLEARALKEQREEQERVQVDIEEAKFQAQRRKEAIEKAKTLQYYQTDRVKGFHGALLLTEVLKEREAQIALKKERSNATGGKDKELLEKHKRDLELGILEDHKKAMERFQERKNLSDFQQMQIQEHIKEREIAVAEDIKEGEELKKQLDHFNTEKAKIDAICRKEKENLMQSHKQTVKDRDLIRACERQKEEEEEEEIRIFAAAKKKMTRMRKERERDIWQKKQDQVTTMVGKLDSQLKQKIDDEDDRISKAVAEREAVREKEMKEKEDHLRKELLDMAEHRNAQMRHQEQAQREERRRELEALQLKMEADKLFAAKQMEKFKQTKTEAKSHQNFLIDQMKEKQVVEIREKEEQLVMDKKNVELLALEEQQFQNYAKEVIDHCEKGGRNTYPLHVAAKVGHGGGRGPVFDGKGGIRPSYLVQDNTGVELPYRQRGSTDEVKYAHVGHPSNTSKRLGFVW